MFAKKVNVRWPLHCSQCGRELSPGEEMILMVYRPAWFDRFQRTMVKGEKQTQFLCIPCLRDAVKIIEDAGQYSAEFSTLAMKKRLKAELKKS